MFNEKALIQKYHGHQPGVPVHRSTGALVSPEPIGVYRLSGAGGPLGK
jgi:hypothetical protein